MNLPEQMKQSHLRATRVCAYALTLGTHDAWEAASAVWQARLTESERATLSWAALRSLHHDEAVAVAELVLGGAGAPSPPFLNPVDDAAWWASIASPSEIDAYALAVVRAMAPGRRIAFLEWVQRRAVA